MGNSGHCEFNTEVPGKSRGSCPLSHNQRHDFLGVYIPLLGLATDEACPICDKARLEGDHQLQCTLHDKYPTEAIVSRYLEARQQMVKKPSIGFG
ncbi:hypothetical protein TNCV_656831 [Trichonephila clavipes]|nr:hypothetical protein TNCV_656831 [Trichonephila clavipes]